MNCPKCGKLGRRPRMSDPRHYCDYCKHYYQPQVGIINTTAINNICDHDDDGFAVGFVTGQAIDNAMNIVTDYQESYVPPVYEAVVETICDTSSICDTVSSVCDSVSDFVSSCDFSTAGDF